MCWIIHGRNELSSFCEECSGREGENDVQTTCSFGWYGSHSPSRVRRRGRAIGGARVQCSAQTRFGRGIGSGGFQARRLGSRFSFGQAGCLRGGIGFRQTRRQRGGFSGGLGHSRNAGVRVGPRHGRAKAGGLGGVLAD